MDSLLQVVKQALRQRTRFEIRRQLPPITLEPFDLVLTLCENHKTQLTVMQIGACDGVTADPLRVLAAKGTAHCVLLEPNPFAFERLSKSYEGCANVTLIQAAIAEKDGHLPFYRVRKSNVPEGEADTTLQIASFYQEHLLSHGVSARDIEEITVACRSLQSLTSELAFERLNILQIDAEGFDAAIVRMALHLPSPPNVINFEHIHLSQHDRQPLYDQLAASDYLLGYDGMNCTAVQRSFLEEIARVRS